MTVRTEAATVYFGGRRRWFSLDAACRAEATAIANRFCDCEKWDGDHVTPPVTCVLHADPDRRERLVTWLAARARRNMAPVAVPAKPEARAIAACRTLVATKAEVDRISRLIGEALNACPLMKEPVEIGPKGPITHLSLAYAVEEVENDNWPGTHREWNSQHLLDECPHCLAAHNAIQERKAARRKLAAARRAITMIGRKS